MYYENGTNAQQSINLEKKKHRKQLAKEHSVYNSFIFLRALMTLYSTYNMCTRIASTLSTTGICTHIWVTTHETGFGC